MRNAHFSPATNRDNCFLELNLWSLCTWSYLLLGSDSGLLTALLGMRIAILDHSVYGTQA